MENITLTLATISVYGRQGMMTVDHTNPEALESMTAAVLDPNTSAEFLEGLARNGTLADKLAMVASPATSWKNLMILCGDVEGQVRRAADRKAKARARTMTKAEFAI